MKPRPDQALNAQVVALEHGSDYRQIECSRACVQAMRTEVERLSSRGKCGIVGRPMQRPGGERFGTERERLATVDFSLAKSTRLIVCPTNPHAALNSRVKRESGTLTLLA